VVAESGHFPPPVKQKRGQRVPQGVLGREKKKKETKKRKGSR